MATSYARDNVLGVSPLETYYLLLNRLEALEAALPTLRCENQTEEDFLAIFPSLTVDIDTLAVTLDDLDEGTHYWQFVHERYDEMFAALGVQCPPWYTPAA
jgi:hypothetical protein